MPPPGQKPELLPKPTRFRMKDGAGTLAAGEEEAFRRKFPSAEVDDDLLSSALTNNTVSLSLSTPAKENGLSNVSSSSNNGNQGYRHNQGGRESPVFDTGVKSLNGNGVSVPTSATSPSYTDYRTPSQRARDLRAAQYGNGSGNRSNGGEVEEEEEEEEEKLVRRNRPSAATLRRQYQEQQQQVRSSSPPVEDSRPSKSLASQKQSHPQMRQEDAVAPSAGVDDSGPVESVRERIQRMNRIGRVA